MWEAIRANKRRSLFLISGLAGVLLVLGYVIALAIDPRAGPWGVAAALAIWLVLWLTAATGGSQMLLASAKARSIRHADHPVVFNVVQEMTIAAGLPKPPDIYIMDTDVPNAFAVGKEDKSAVAVTTGLLTRLNRDELQGVIAHEIGHIKNRDTRFMTLAGVMVAAIVLLADAFVRGMYYSGRGRRRSSGKGAGQAQAIMLLVALLLAVLAPIVAQILYFACSRRREYLADASSARFTRYPDGLASALEKISGSARRVTTKKEKFNRALAPMFIINPLQAIGGVGLFSTHPPTVERMRVLRSMGRGAAYADYEAAFANVTGAHLLGGRTLAGSHPVSVRDPSPEPEKDDVEKAREAVDILHRLNGLLFLSCVCGLKMKVPPSYKGDHVKCPRCGRVHAIPTGALAAASVAAAGELGEAASDDVAGEGEGAGEEPPRVFRSRPGQWDSFRCACGETIQLSPSFSAPQVRCPHCGRETKVVQQ